jgi:hypothetical protein
MSINSGPLLILVSVTWLQLNRHKMKELNTNISLFCRSGPRLFLSCPMDINAVQVWFNDLWNYSIVPYLIEAIKEGVQVSFKV